MTIQKVALLGARGRLGPWLLEALVESGKFEVSVLQRAESTFQLDSKYAGKVESIKLPPDFLNAQEETVKALTGLDALVISIPGDSNREQQFLANCCISARVKRFIPADYGSVDSSDKFCADTVPLYRKKKIMRDILQGLAMMYSYQGFSWTSLVCGHFFDHGIETPLLGFDIAADPIKATVFDGGDIKWSTSTRAQIGRAVVAILENEQQTKNRMLYIQSFAVTQNQVLDALKRATGKAFTIEQIDSRHYIEQKKEEVEKGIGNDPVMELVGVLGLTRAEWTQKADFSNGLLGLQEQDLVTEVEKALAAMKKS